MANSFGGLRRENYFNSLQDENQIKEYRTVYNQQRQNGYNSDEAMDIAQQHVMKMTKAPAPAAPSVNIPQKQMMVDPYPGFKMPITGQKVQWLFSANQKPVNMATDEDRKTAAWTPSKLTGENYFNSLSDQNQIEQYRNAYNTARENGMRSADAMAEAQSVVESGNAQLKDLAARKIRMDDVDFREDVNNIMGIDVFNRMSTEDQDAVMNAWGADREHGVDAIYGALDQIGAGDKYGINAGNWYKNPQHTQPEQTKTEEEPKQKVTRPETRRPQEVQADIERVEGFIAHYEKSREIYKDDPDEKREASRRLAELYNERSKLLVEKNQSQTDWDIYDDYINGVEDRLSWENVSKEVGIAQTPVGQDVLAGTGENAINAIAEAWHGMGMATAGTLAYWTRGAEDALGVGHAVSNFFRNSEAGWRKMYNLAVAEGNKGAQKALTALGTAMAQLGASEETIKTAKDAAAFIEKNVVHDPMYNVGHMLPSVFIDLMSGGAGTAYNIATAGTEAAGALAGRSVVQQLVAGGQAAMSHSGFGATMAGELFGDYYEKLSKGEKPTATDTVWMMMGAFTNSLIEYGGGDVASGFQALLEKDVGGLRGFLHAESGETIEEISQLFTGRVFENVSNALQGNKTMPLYSDQPGEALICLAEYWETTWKTLISTGVMSGAHYVAGALTNAIIKSNTGEELTDDEKAAAQAFAEAFEEGMLTQAEHDQFEAAANHEEAETATDKPATAEQAEPGRHYVPKGTPVERVQAEEAQAEQTQAEDLEDDVLPDVEVNPALEETAEAAMPEPSPDRMTGAEQRIREQDDALIQNMALLMAQDPEAYNEETRAIVSDEMARRGLEVPGDVVLPAEEAQAETEQAVAPAPVQHADSARRIFVAGDYISNKTDEQLIRYAREKKIGNAALQAVEDEMRARGLEVPAEQAEDTQAKPEQTEESAAEDEQQTETTDEEAVAQAEEELREVTIPEIAAAMTAKMDGQETDPRFDNYSEKTLQQVILRRHKAVPTVTISDRVQTNQQAAGADRLAAEENAAADTTDQQTVQRTEQQAEAPVQDAPEAAVEQPSIEDAQEHVAADQADRMTERREEQQAQAPVQEGPEAAVEEAQDTRKIEKLAKRYHFKTGKTQGDGSADTGVHLNTSDANFSKTKWIDLQMVDRASKIIGWSVEVVDELPHNANGMYAKGRTLYISKNTENLFTTTASHELYHMVKNVNPEGAEKIKDVFMKWAARDGFDVEAEIKARQESYARQGVKLEREDAEEELIANSFYSFLHDQQVMREVYSESPSLYQRIVDFVHRIQQSIREMLGEYEENTPEAQMLAEQDGALTELHQTMLDVLNEMRDLDGTKKAVSAVKANGEMTRRFETAVKEATNKKMITQAARELGGDVLRKTGNQAGQENFTRLMNAAQDVNDLGTLPGAAMRDNGLSYTQNDAEVNRALQKLGAYAAQLKAEKDVQEYVELVNGLSEVGSRSEEGESKYSINSEDTKLREQAQKYNAELADMDPVADVQSELDLKPYYARGAKSTGAAVLMYVSDELKKYNGVIRRNGFPEIEFYKGKIRAGGHINGYDYLFLTAVPSVVENGKKLNYHENHKGNGYPTWTFGAPVTVDGKPVGNMLVVIRFTNNKHRYYLHKVITPDGGVFTLNQKETQGAVRYQALSADIDADASRLTPPARQDPSVDIIAQNDSEVKQNLTDAAALQADQEQSNGEETAYGEHRSFSLRVRDQNELDFLENQKTEKTYKTMQLVDGKLYPPMAAVVAGNMEDHSELGTWEKATEHPELIKDGNKFTLNKGRGKGSLAAAYNPYMHSSNLMINDQFSGAWNRPELVTVECEVPVSENTSGYHAQYAKDSVGWHKWHTGTVAGQLHNKKGIERQVFLSRWIKPVRIVPDAEVAQHYKDLIEGTDIEIPDNVVSPSLRQALEDAGVPIKVTGKVKEQKFSLPMEKPVEQTRDLVAVHNLSVDKLNGALELGGLPMPSIAVTKSKIGHKTYGDVSLVFGKETIDPQKKDNKVYGRDAWTTTFPNVERQINQKKSDQLYSELNKGGKGLPEYLKHNILRVTQYLNDESMSDYSALDLVKNARENTGLMAAYLAEKGEVIEPVMGHEAPKPAWNVEREQWFDKLYTDLAGIVDSKEEFNNAPMEEMDKRLEELDGRYARLPKPRRRMVLSGMYNYLNRVMTEERTFVDEAETDKKIRETINQEEFQKWLADKLDGLFGEKAIARDVDRYTPSGNRKSFAQTHAAYTLDNIVAEMRKKAGKAEQSGFLTGYNRFAGAAAKEYRSIEEMRADEGRLTEWTEDIQKEYEARQNELLELINEIKGFRKKSIVDNEFIVNDIITQNLVEAATGKQTEADVGKILRRYYPSITPEVVKKAVKVIKEAAELPAMYYEAKPQRGVGLNEVRLAVVPESTDPQLIERLRAAGVADIRTYPDGDQEARKAIINGADTLKFSLPAETRKRDTEYMQAVESGDEEKQRELVKQAAEDAGYDTPRLYHGTGAFGFTEFDLEKGEQLIFATSDRKVAETYSGKTNRSRISESTKLNTDDLHGEELLAAAQKHLEKYGEYHLMTEDERADEADNTRENLRDYWRLAKDFVADHVGAFNQEKQRIVDGLVKSLENLSHARNEAEIEDAWSRWDNGLWNLKWIDESITDELISAVGTHGLNAYKNRLSDLMYGGDIYSDSDAMYYIFDNQLALELDSELHKGVYELYGKSGKQLVVDCKGANWNEIDAPEELHLYGKQRTRDIAAAAKANGYDSVLLKNLYDLADYGYRAPADIYIFLNAEQVKSADPITYDDQGNVIPLSERFNDQKTDIRYSMPDEPSEADKRRHWDRQMESTGGQTQLMQDITGKLWNAIVDRKQTQKAEQYGIWRQQVSELAQGILEDTNSQTLSAREIEQRLTQIFEEYEGKKTGTAEEAENAANDALNEIRGLIEEALSDQVMDEHYRTVKDALRKGIYISPDEVKEQGGAAELRDVRNKLSGFTRVYTNEAAANKAGALHLSGHGWDELQSVDPSLFNPETHWLERLQAIVDFVETYRDSTAIYDPMTRDFIRSKALEVMAGYYTGSSETDAGKRTKAALDKANKRVRQLTKQAEVSLQKQLDLEQQVRDAKAEAKAAKDEAWKQEIKATRPLQDTIKQLNEQIKAAREETKAAGQELTAAKDEAEALRDQLETADNRAAYLDNIIRILKQENKRNQEAAVRDDRRRTREKAKQRAADMKARHNIKKTADELKRMVAKPTENAYVPMDKLTALNELLKAFQSGDRRRIDRTTEAWMKRVREMRESNNTVTAGIYEAGFEKQMQEACDILKDKGVNDLDNAELQYVSNTFTEALHQIKNATKMIGRKNDNDAFLEGANAIEVNNSQKGMSANGIKRMGQKYTMAQLRPKSFFKMLAGYGENAWSRQGDDFNEAQRKQNRSYQLMTDEVRGLPQGKENEKKFDRFRGKNAELIDTGYKDRNGKAIKITQAQRVSMYLHSLNDQNLRHFMYGVTLPDQELLKAGKKEQAYERPQTLRLINPENYHSMDERMAALRAAVAKITDGMTDYEKAWVAAYRKVEGKSTRYINETSLQLNGYEKATVENYFPIKTDRNFLATDFESLVRDGTIEGMGMLKERVNGTNPMVIEDVTDVIDRMINNTSLYYGMAIPVRNFNKMYNATMAGYEDSVKASTKRTWGTDGAQYLEKLLSDLQGNGRREERTFLDSFRSKYAGAVLTLNPSVMMKQAASLPTAAASLGWRPIMRALSSTKKVSVELINKYTSAYLERANGGIRDMEANAQRNTVVKKGLFKLGNGIQAVDLATVRKIWLAAEYYVQEQQPSLKQGTDEYYEAVARAWETALEDTQPEYGVMQRPHILRSSNQLVRSLVMFKTQSMQNFNILYDAVMELRAKRVAYKANATAENKAQLDQAKTNMARAASSQIVSAVVLAVMTALGKALLHKPEPYQDEKGELTAESVSYQLSKDAISSMAGMVVGGSELFDLIVGISEGKAPYDIEAGSISLLNDIYQSIYKLGNAAGAIGDSSLTTEQKLQKLGKPGKEFAENIAAAYGIPAANIEKIFTSAYKYVDDIISGRGLEGLTTGDVSLSTGARYMGQALQKGDQETYVRLYNRLLRQGKTQSQINSAMKTWMKTNDPRIQQAANAIDGGDIDTYNRLINEMTADGYGMANVVTAIEAVRKAAAAAESGELSVENGVNTPLSYDQIMAAQENDSASAYTYAQLNQLLESGNTQAARKVQSALFKSKGTTAVKSALTSYWKPKYQEAYQQRNRTELNRIVRLLKTMGYSDSSINKWKTAETTTTSSKKKSSSRFGGGFGGSFGSSKKKSSRFGGGFGGGWGG